MHRIQQQAAERLEQAAMLPDCVRFDFDPGRETTARYDGDQPAGLVQKTTRRTVVSLEHGRFQAREIVRQQTGDGAAVIDRSAQLANVVPSGARYGFDLIAHVGVQTYLHGHSLQDVRQNLAQRRPAIDISPSSLWDQQQKFLFYLGALHEQAAPQLSHYLAEHGPVTWLLDGTVEPDTPVFLGVQHAASGLMLLGRKIASENVDDIVPCLTQAVTQYGQPDRVLHDLSPAMSGACDVALPGVPQFVCHYHLARDVGADLYEAPQVALTERLRKLKVQFRLREQRRGQTEWLRERLDPSAQGVVSRLLAGEPINEPFDNTLGREVLLALHFWILDYRSDGRRRGFPFDPYTLYLHRRLVRAGEAVDRLMTHSVAQQSPHVLRNFQEQLKRYRNDAEITAVAAAYERACAMFLRLREALRLSAEHMDQLRQPHDLPVTAQQELKTALQNLRSELRRQSEDENDADQPLAQTVLGHLDKYWLHLVPNRLPGEGERWERTTNQLESEWCGLKRGRRQTHGRGKLTRDFQALPEEYLLVPNLANPTYVDLVLGGSLTALPSKLAAASRTAGSFAAWRERRRPCLIGHVPRRLIREDEFLDHLGAACQRHCQKSVA